MKKTNNSQLANRYTYRLYRDELQMLAQNVYQIKNLPELIDADYINNTLLYKGSVAFFKDDILGLLALPYVVVGKPDIYGRPKRIKCVASNGYNSKILSSEEFVIMYDNSLKTSIISFLWQYAERLALIQRTIDINVGQQKTPRIIKAPQNKLLSIKNMFNEVDAFENTIVGYDNFDLEGVEMILAPAPYVTDKLETEKEKIWNEAMRFIGISSLTEQKKERLIKDEVSMSQGGTIASRIARYECRKKAVDKINEKFSDLLKEPLELSFYDGLPSTLVDDSVNYGLRIEEEDAAYADDME